MNDLAFKTIQELKELLKNGSLSRDEILDYFITRAEKNKDLGALLEVFDKKSILADAKSDGILNSIPGYIKDNICQKDRIASCGSKMLEQFRSTYDATATARLREAGALILGRTNMDEFAMGSSGETSAFFKTKNPWNKECVPGGSSSGSAAAVAAGLAPWALGSDTGGSVRQPAAFCGIVGLKPTYGLISRYGLIAYGSSLDTVGIFTRTAYDNALVLSTLAGLNPKDSSSLEQSSKDYTSSLDGSLKKGLVIGVIEDALQAEGLHPEVRQATEDAVKVYESMGATVKRVCIKALEYCAASYFVISRAEAASNLARFDGVRYGLRAPEKDLTDMYEKTRHDGFGPEVRARIMVGNYVLSVGHANAYYENAQRVRRIIRKELQEAFASVDLLVMPTQSAPAFKIGAFDNDKLAMDLQDYFTAPVNLTGVPSISIPVGFSTCKLPLGMQLIGPHLSEELLYQTAHAYQQITDWHKQHPSL